LSVQFLCLFVCSVSMSLCLFSFYVSLSVQFLCLCLSVLLSISLNPLSLVSLTLSLYVSQCLSACLSIYSLCLSFLLHFFGYNVLCQFVCVSLFPALCHNVYFSASLWEHFHSKQFRAMHGATTFSIMIFSIRTLSIMDLIVTLTSKTLRKTTPSIIIKCRYVITLRVSKNLKNVVKDRVRSQN
jgi:hypothetical protein